MAKNQVNVNVSQVIDRIGFGKFQIFAIFVVCVRIFCYGSETSMLVILEPYLRCKWNLDFLSAAMIVLPSTCLKIIASPVIGKFADMYGRRSMVLMLCAMQSFTSLLNLLSSSLFMIALTRAAIGFQSCGLVIMQIYLMEVLPTTARKYMSLITLSYGLGSIYSILTAMVTLEYLNWRWYIAFTETVPLAIALGLVLLLPESPRYLCVTGQENASVKVLEKIAKLNGGEPGYNMIVEADADDVEPSDGQLKAKADNPLSRFEIARRIGLLSLLHFVSYSFGIAVRFGTMQIAENTEAVQCKNCAHQLTYKYRWAFEVGLVVSFAISYICVGKLKRGTAIKSLLISMIVAWAFLYYDFRGLYLMVLTCINSALCSAIILVGKVYQAEIIPTSVRATGNGVSAAAMQLGYLLGQFLPLYLYHVNLYLSYGIVHGLLVLGLLASFTIFVETKDEELQDF